METVDVKRCVCKVSKYIYFSVNADENEIKLGLILSVSQKWINQIKQFEYAWNKTKVKSNYVLKKDRYSSDAIHDHIK